MMLRDRVYFAPGGRQRVIGDAVVLRVRSELSFLNTLITQKASDGDDIRDTSRGENLE